MHVICKWLQYYFFFLIFVLLISFLFCPLLYWLRIPVVGQIALVITLAINRESEHTTLKYVTLAYWLGIADAGRAHCISPFYLKSGYKFPMRKVSSLYQEERNILIISDRNESVQTNLTKITLSSISFLNIFSSHFPTIYCP